MEIAYTKLDFVNGATPALSAPNLNHIDEGVKACADAIDAMGDVVSRDIGITSADVAAGDAPAAAQAAAEAALAGHVAAEDPHTQYAKESALGDAAAKNVGTGVTNVAAGNAPASAVTTHESAYPHANIPSAAPTATPTASRVPIADASGKLTGWIDAATDAVAGKVELATETEFIAGTDVSRIPAVSTIAASMSRQAHRFARMLGHKLKSAVEPLVIGIIADSTSNEIWEWFYLSMQWLAEKFPAYTFIHRLWSDTTQSYSDYDYDSPGVKAIQYGLAGDGYADCGGGRAIIADKESLRITGDLEIVSKIACIDYSYSSEQTIACKMGDSGNYGWSLFIDIYGYPKLWWSSTGSNQIIKPASVPLPTANGADVWIKATLDVDNGADGNTVRFYTSANGTNWTQLGTSIVTAGVTSVFASTADIHIGSRNSSQPLIGRIYRLFVKNGINGAVVASPDFGQAHPSIVTTFSDLEGNAITKTGTISWGLGSPCVILANASVSGQTAAYFNNGTRFALVTAHEMALQFVSLSHNEMTTVDYTTIKTLIAAIVAKYPNVGMVLCAQNPQQAPLVYLDHHAIRCGQVAQYAAVMDYGLVDVFAVFKALGDFSGYMADGAHPNAAGTALWAEEVEKFLAGALA